MSEILDSLSHPSLVKAAELTCQTAIGHLGRIFAARFYRESNATWFVTDPIGFNKVIDASFAADTSGSTIDETLKHIAASIAPSDSISWGIGPSLRSTRLEDYLHTNGWSRNEEVQSMILDLNTLKIPVEDPTGLTIEVVDNLGALKQHLDVMTAGFGFPEPIVNYISGIDYDQTFLDLPGVRYYVGRVHGQAVAISLVLLCEGLAGIYNVATLPQMRHRGFGTAMTNAALLGALEQGYRIAVLQASEMGASIYRKLGFQDHFTFDSYSLNK